MYALLNWYVAVRLAYRLSRYGALADPNPVRDAATGTAAT